MPNIRMKRSEIFLLLIFFFLTSSLASAALAAYPLAFTDDSGSRITFDQKPSRVVSLVPSITEILFRIGAGDVVKGVTYHSTYPPEAATREIVGGFFSPSLKRIEAMIFSSGVWFPDEKTTEPRRFNAVYIPDVARCSLHGCFGRSG